MMATNGHSHQTAQEAAAEQVRAAAKLQRRTLAVQRRYCLAKALWWRAYAGLVLALAFATVAAGLWLLANL